MWDIKKGKLEVSHIAQLQTAMDDCDWNFSFKEASALLLSLLTDGIRPQNILDNLLYMKSLIMSFPHIYTISSEQQLY